MLTSNIRMDFFFLKTDQSDIDHSMNAGARWADLSVSAKLLGISHITVSKVFYSDWCQKKTNKQTKRKNIQ